MGDAASTSDFGDGGSRSAIARLIGSDPQRILTIAARFRGAGKTLECRLRGGSMEPAIPREARLSILLGPTTPYEVGDVVAVVDGSRICVHRVVYLGSGGRHGYVITQGDACYYPDPPTKTEYILGRVTAYEQAESWREPGASRSSDRARSKTGSTLLFLVAALLKIHVGIARFCVRVLRVRRDRKISETVKDGDMSHKAL